MANNKAKVVWVQKDRMHLWWVALEFLQRTYDVDHFKTISEEALAEKCKDARVLLYRLEPDKPDQFHVDILQKLHRSNPMLIIGLESDKMLQGLVGTVTFTFCFGTPKERIGELIKERVR